MTVKRGDIYYADLSPVVGSEQGGVRPVLIIQNDIGNRYSPTVIAAAITSQQEKTSLPTHIKVNADQCGLSRDSIILLKKKWVRLIPAIWIWSTEPFRSASVSVKICVFSKQ